MIREGLGITVQFKSQGGQYGLKESTDFAPTTESTANEQKDLHSSFSRNPHTFCKGKSSSVLRSFFGVSGSLILTDTLSYLLIP